MEEWAAAPRAVRAVRVGEVREGEATGVVERVAVERAVERVEERAVEKVVELELEDLEKLKVLLLLIQLVL